MWVYLCMCLSKCHRTQCAIGTKWCFERSLRPEKHYINANNYQGSLLKNPSLIRFCLRFIKLHNCTKKIKYCNLLQSSIYGFCVYLMYINDPLLAHLASIHCQSDGWGEAKVSYVMIFVKQQCKFKCTSLNVTYVCPLLWSIHLFFF